ncbi:MAG TPA: hypothetical protein VFY05_01100 [Candidatus Angelobacter sp.]|nr:hypothetical protein [Candidatus Angelobacter sp.]
MRIVLALLFLLSFCPNALFAGPPFQLDDPDVIPYHWHEFYAWTGASSSPGVVGTSGPAIEFNWSLIRNSMFHFILPLGASIPNDGPTNFGLADGEFGFQDQFLSETKHRPMIGTFVMMELPWGDSSRGLGAGAPSWKFPLYAKKTIGGWSIDGGGGINISSRVPGGRNYPFGGTLITHDVSKKRTLGSEVFSHGRPTADPTDSRYAVDVDLGGYYTFDLQHPGFQLMFAYGHSVAGQTENYAYLALYWTWGPKPK